MQFRYPRPSQDFVEQELEKAAIDAINNPSTYHEGLASQDQFSIISTMGQRRWLAYATAEEGINTVEESIRKPLKIFQRIEGKNYDGTQRVEFRVANYISESGEIKHVIFMRHNLPNGNLLIYEFNIDELEPTKNSYPIASLFLITPKGQAINLLNDIDEDVTCVLNPIPGNKSKFSYKPRHKIITLISSIRLLEKALNQPEQINEFAILHEIGHAVHLNKFSSERDKMLLSRITNVARRLTSPSSFYGKLATHCGNFHQSK